MPFCASCANSLRGEFGAEGINAQIKAGHFYARENGIELGTKAPDGVIATFVPVVTVGKEKRGR